MSHVKTPNELIIEQLEKEVKIRRAQDQRRDFLTQHGEEYVALKEAELALKRNLPHLYGFPWYQWAFDFFTCTHKMSFLCAANQISKSSTQIRKCIDWATSPDRWEHLWPGKKPNQFWYLYPTSNQSSIEFEKKWMDFLPRGEFKDHLQYGWKEEWKNKEIFALHFNSGITVYFKTYKQGLEALQTGTVFAVFLDEECPEELWDELVFRVSAVDGYIHMVFTATIGQEMWRQTIEPKDDGEEKFPGAWKRQVSMYDCQFYMDGTPSHWTPERVSQVIATCKSHQEVQRRVFGKFVKDSGLKYPQFDMKKHMKRPHPLPPSWITYVGVDIGAGGEEGHPSGICILAVRPDFKQGRVIEAWRGDGIRTTASDIYLRAEGMIRDLNIQPAGKFYDWASAEFGEIANRNGGAWLKAEKSHEKGEQIINVLFRNDMMGIYETGETSKLAGELSSLTVDGPKRKKKDDLADAFRYAVVSIPWDWTAIHAAVTDAPENEGPKFSAEQMEVAERRKAFLAISTEEETLENEFAEWNAAYDW